MVGTKIFFGQFESELVYDDIKNEYFKEKNFKFPTPGSYNPPPNTNYTQVQCSVKPKNIGHLVGDHGKAFIAITEQSGVEYIWINKETKIIEIWGHEDNFPDARRRLVKRMKHIEYISDQKIENARLKLIERTRQNA